MDKKLSSKQDQARLTPDVSHLLAMLTQLTSIRDPHLLEEYLLRTLVELLYLPSGSLYRVNDDNSVLRSIDYNPSAPEPFSERVNDKTTTPDLIALFAQLHPLSDPVTVKGLTGYALQGTEGTLLYFICHSTVALNTNENALIRSIFDIYTNYNGLLDTSHRDRLTGLLNRYSLENNLDHLWHFLAESQRQARENGNRRDSEANSFYWMGIIDIDHFKRVNDTYGHLMGDEILLVVTRLLRSSLRRTDLVYRYGGEEFVVIIATRDLASAHLVYERLRRVVEQHDFPQVGKITISIGFSGASADVLPQAVLNRADRALYKAKDDGRNRVYHFETLLQENHIQEVDSGSVELF